MYTQIYTPLNMIVTKKKKLPLQILELRIIQLKPLKNMKMESKMSYFGSFSRTKSYKIKNGCQNISEFTKIIVN